MLLATIFNNSVPDRFKLGDSEFTVRMGRYRAIPKRQLLKDLYCGWRSVDVRLRRGFVSPPLSFGKRLAEFSWDVAERIKDGHETSAEEFAEMVYAYGLVAPEGDDDTPAD